MQCPQCSNSMVSAQATNFGASYFYCRTCKKELSEMPGPSQLPQSSRLEVPTTQFKTHSPLYQKVKRVETYASEIQCAFALNVPSGTPPSMFFFSIPLTKDCDYAIDWITNDPAEIAVPWYGVDRRLDPTRLAGVHYKANKFMDIEDEIAALSVYCARGGATPEILLLPPDKYTEFCISKGFTGTQFPLTYALPGSIVEVFPDYSLVNTGMLIDLDTWTLYENSVLGTAALVCSNPGGNGRIHFT